MAIRGWHVSVFSIALALNSAAADDLLHRYEGDVLPYAPGAGWVINRACEGGCSESLKDGHLVVIFVKQAVAGAFLYNYLKPIAGIGEPNPSRCGLKWDTVPSSRFPPSTTRAMEKFPCGTLIGSTLLTFLAMLRCQEAVTASSEDLTTMSFTQFASKAPMGSTIEYQWTDMYSSCLLTTKR